MDMMERSKAKNKAALSKIVSNLKLEGDGVECPQCKEVWNRLTPKGVCFDCANPKWE